MSVDAIVGINWGDEGKGRMVDLISDNYDIVVRYQGGNNAGHTVINEYGKFALNLLPSGVFRKNTLNILGTGTVIDLEHLVKEIENVSSKGVNIDADNLKISNRAIICFPFHRDQDRLEEIRLGSKKYGSTVRGIAPVYGDKYMKKGIQVGELLHPQYLKERLSNLLEWKNVVMNKVYGAEPYKISDVIDWLLKYGSKIKNMICDTNEILKNAASSGKNILFEAQLGALRDIHYGIYPFTSSSCPLASFAPVGAGLFNHNIDDVIGVVKAYSTCVGEGPFITEIFDEIGSRLREIGAEYGAATGRPRRIGYFDLVATKYGIEIQGATKLALTKLDVLSAEKSIKVCIGYKIGSEIVTGFPITPILKEAKPIYAELDGWEEDITQVREYGSLPTNAKKYIEYIENWLGKPFMYISVGPRREEIIIK